MRVLEHSSLTGASGGIKQLHAGSVLHWWNHTVTAYTIAVPSTTGKPDDARPCASTTNRYEGCTGGDELA